MHACCIVTEAVSNAEMLVGTNNSVKVGSQKHITITAEGRYVRTYTLDL